MKNIGLTSVHAGQSTASLLESLREQGIRPVVVTEERNIERLRQFISPDDFGDAVVVSTFLSPRVAAKELAARLAKRRMSLSNWINLTDDTTAFFLCACRQIGLDFDFLDTYEKCRIKPLARNLASQAGLSAINYTIHDIDAFRSPRGFLFPFVVKPLLGSGSKGVQLVHGPNAWNEYLESAKHSFASDDVSVRGFYPGRQALVEEVLAGQECQLDGFVEHGRMKVCSIGMKHCALISNGFREVSGVLYRPFAFPDSAAHDKRLVDWTRRLLRAIDFRSGTFHVEIKVNGASIELVEINPRPGGGANVPAIKRLSGIDLNNECIRLWLGLGKITRQKPQNASIAFAVRYPSKVGTVGFVRQGGKVQQLRTSLGTELEWYPLVRQGDLLNPVVREQYLGVILAADFCKSLENVPTVAAELQKVIQRRSFVAEN